MGYRGRRGQRLLLSKPVVGQNIYINIYNIYICHHVLIVLFCDSFTASVPEEANELVGENLLSNRGDRC